MNLSESANQALSRVIEKGVENSAEKLAKMSRTKWSMQTVAVNAGPGERLQTVLKDDVIQHYGAFFTMPGGFILVVISDTSGKKVVSAYLGSSAQRMQNIPNLDREVIAEIANVLVNAVAGEFADTCKIGFLLSAPDMSRGTRKALYAEILKRFPAANENLAVSSYVHMTSEALSTDCSMIILLDDTLAGKVLEALDEAV
ncbi:MAG: hypothetical protein HY078_06175 [Elusimicrobia bacterium]|nr:hypothetical protein [Elusimicrobiota bacterium]